jgi:hypothetical protein
VTCTDECKESMQLGFSHDSCQCCHDREYDRVSAILGHGLISYFTTAFDE